MKSWDIAPLKGYDHQVGLLLATLKDSTCEWRADLGQPPVEAPVWQPAKDSHSIGSVILHIIDVEAYWLETFCAGKRRSPKDLKLLLSKEIKQYGASWPKPPAEPIEWYYDLHDRIRERCFDAIRGIEPEKWIPRKDYELTFRYVLGHVIQHDSYHGGQAVLLHELWKKNK